VELGRSLELTEVKSILAEEFRARWPEFLAAAPPTP